MKVPQTFLPEKELTDIIKRALEEHDKPKKQEPVDLSKLNYDAVEFEYKDGTREVLRADCLAHTDGGNMSYPFYSYDLLSYFSLKKDSSIKSIHVTDENDPKKVIKVIDGNFIKAIRTNYLRLLE